MDNARRAAAFYLEDSRDQLAAKLLALCRDDGDRMSVIGVFPECGQEYAERTEELFRYSSSIGANLTVLYSTQPAAVTDIIISEDDASGAARLFEKMLPEVSVTLVPPDSGSFSLFAPGFFAARADAARMLRV